jgi:5'-deoxynucleotidase YfbR-like HD superfamily hydrolase
MESVAAPRGPLPETGPESLRRQARFLREADRLKGVLRQSSILELLIHDLVEIDAGDLFLYADAAAQARQEVAEHAAADRLFTLLPPGQGPELRAVWDEFEERRTPEARFARELVDSAVRQGFLSPGQ